MTEHELTTLLEDALRAQVTSRCKRAYGHDLKNGLQALYGGIDVLIRAAQNPQSMRTPVERVIDHVRQAIAKHQETLDHVLEHLIPELRQEHTLNIVARIQDVVTFLRNDAAHNSVTFRVDLSDEPIIDACPARLRLVFLALLLDAIDASPAGGEGQLQGEVTDGRFRLVISGDRVRVAESDIDAAASRSVLLPAYQNILLPVTRRIVLEEGGEFDAVEDVQTARRVMVSFPVSTASRS